MPESIRQQIQAQVKASQAALVAALRDLVAIESVRGEARPQAPYGPGPKAALDKALEIAHTLGFQTKNIDNKVGYAQYGQADPNDPQAYYGIFGHVDVVPLGEGWKHGPLASEIEAGRIYGRGVLDNKGPILANLFALKILKDLGVEFPIPVRIVFGSNEETGFDCIKHYLTKEPAPRFGWTPDCKWPVVYGERGRLQVRILAELEVLDSLFNFVNSHILQAPASGQALGVDFSDDDFGQMIMRGYHFGMTDQKQAFFQWSLSYPGVTSQAEIVAAIQEGLPQNLSLEVIHNWDPILYDKDSLYVQTLQKVYCEVTDLEAEPVTTTGGTYAKLVPNIIAYGPSFPGQRDIAHLPDEWMDLQDLETNTLIYCLASYDLAQL